MSDKLPPHSIEAEQGLLGAALLDDDCARELVRRVGADISIFHDERNQYVYGQLRDLVAQGKPPEFIRLNSKGVEPGYIATLESACHSPANFPAWFDEVFSIYQRRASIEGLEDGLNLLRGGTKPELVLRGVTAALRAGNNRVGLSIRRPSEILAMEFDESDRILGDRLLAKGQPMTILGPGGLGKSRLLLQLAVCQITGNPFLGLETHANGLRWLIFQTENSTRRLQRDLRAMASAENWKAIDHLLAIHTVEHEHDGFLSLDNSTNEGRIADVIDEVKPDIVSFDPLKDFAIGDLNSDSDMAATCQALSRITKAGNPDRSIIVVHHSGTGKAGAARSVGYDRASYGRNSKVLHSWTRGQINVVPGSAEDNTSLVLSCGKCSNGQEFERFAARLNTDTMVYQLDPDFDLESWDAEITGKKSESVTIDLVSSLCRGTMSRADLAKAIMNDSGCVKQYAYRKIKQAEAARKIHFNRITEKYVAR